jgi:hypothetical protein
MRRRVMMKGQLIFEFVIATLFFLAIVMYTISYINTTVFAFSENHYSSMLENNAWQVSETLVTGKGVWSGTDPNMVPEELGLAEDWPVLNNSKIDSLDNWCGTRLSEMATLLDVDPEFHGISIKIYRKTAAGEENIADCGSLPTRIPNALVTRFGVRDTDSSLLKVMVWYW